MQYVQVGPETLPLQLVSSGCGDPGAQAGFALRTGSHVEHEQRRRTEPTRSPGLTHAHRPLAVCERCWLRGIVLSAEGDGCPVTRALPALGTRHISPEKGPGQDTKPAFDTQWRQPRGWSDAAQAGVADRTQFPVRQNPPPLLCPRIPHDCLSPLPPHREPSAGGRCPAGQWFESIHGLSRALWGHWGAGENVQGSGPQVG